MLLAKAPGFFLACPFALPCKIVTLVSNGSSEPNWAIMKPPVTEMRPDHALAAGIDVNVAMAAGTSIGNQLDLETIRRLHNYETRKPKNVASSGSKYQAWWHFVVLFRTRQMVLESTPGLRTGTQYDTNRPCYPYVHNLQWEVPFV